MRIVEDKWSLLPEHPATEPAIEMDGSGARKEQLETALFDVEH